VGWRGKGEDLFPQLVERQDVEGTGEECLRRE
jgi:hypothetical protein